MYAESDSDNESDFDIKYEKVNDSFDDLSQLKKPIFISDLILGL